MTNQLLASIKEQTPELCTKVIDVLPIPIYCKGLDGNILLCNNAFSRIIGEPKDKIIGNKIIDMLLPKQVDVLFFRDADILNNGKDQFYEAKLGYADGDNRDVIINKSALYSNNKITGIISSIIDITERQKALSKLAQAEEEKLISIIMLQKIRAGIVIVDENLHVIDSNLAFAKTFGDENVELFETIPGLKGADLDMLVPRVIYDMFNSILESGENRLERDFKFQNKLLSVGLITIVKNKIAGAIIRDLSAPMLERAEIIDRAKQVNRKNLKTVQKIAFLLGENAAQTEELLNSIIESQKYDVDENEPL